MTLDNLVAIGRLAYLSPDITAIARLMRAAERNLAETAHPGISADTKFDIAYKSIMQCALAALASSGFRPSKSQPGHHQTAIQSLAKTVGIGASEIVVLDALRKARNLSDYSGDPVSDATTSACIEAAETLLARTREWLESQPIKKAPPAARPG